MIDYFTPLHAAVSIAGVVLATELFYRTHIVKDYTKAIVYSAAAVFTLGVLKEVNDLYQILNYSGIPDILDLCMDAIGVITGILIEDRKANNNQIYSGMRTGIENIVSALYHD